MNNEMTKRDLLAHWCAWFAIANAVLFCLLGLSYLPDLPSFYSMPLLDNGGRLIAAVFTGFALIGQLAFFALLSGLLVFLIALILPWRRVIISIGIALATLLTSLIIIDSCLYHLYQFHLAGVIWQIISSGAISQSLDMSSIEWVMLLLVVVVLFIIEWGLALQIWRWVHNGKKPRHTLAVISVLLLSLLSSYLIYFSVIYLAKARKTAARIDAKMLVQIARVVPYYNYLAADVAPFTWDNAALSGESGLHLLNHQNNQTLQYPLHPLVDHVKKRRLNIVVIAIDSWRYDMFNASVTPNIYRLAQRSLVFTRNDSGGNCTRPGIFSLFYSLPATYWRSMLQQKLGPVFIKQLQKEHYRTGVFVSASLSYPDFKDTVFRDITNLPAELPEVTVALRDQAITRNFKHFVHQQSATQPFFSFVFYDEVHNWCGSKQAYAKPFQPAVTTCNRLLLTNQTNPKPYLNRYKNAVYFVDQLIGKDIQALKAKGLLKNTIIIVTSDHGEEFNDTGLGLWGHASGYDDYQIHTPLIVYWPGKSHQVIDYRTSHYDIVPTLMRNVLGVTNPVSDYSVGQSLFMPAQKFFTIVSSYTDYAIVQPHRMTTIYAGGYYAIDQLNGQALPAAKLRSQVLRQVYTDLNRYYQ